MVKRKGYKKYIAIVLFGAASWAFYLIINSVIFRGLQWVADKTGAAWLTDDIAKGAVLILVVVILAMLFFKTKAGAAIDKIITK